MSTTSEPKPPYDFTNRLLDYAGRPKPFGVGPVANRRLNALIALAQETGTLTSRQANEAIGGPVVTIAFYIGVLVRLGVLTRVQRGYYKLGDDYAKK